MTPLHPRGCSTERLDLRPVTPSDRHHLVALEADPEVMRFLNGGQSVPEAGCPDADFLTPRGTEPEVLAAHERAPIPVQLVYPEGRKAAAKVRAFVDHAVAVLRQEPVLQGDGALPG